MSFLRFNVRRVAVLGAGLMGAQIAALFANASVEPILFDLPSKEGDPNALIKRALADLKLLNPNPLIEKTLADIIQPANYDHDLALLKDCDLIIETLPERLDWKLDLYRKISGFLTSKNYLLSNTSCLSIEKLSEGLGLEQKTRFCGIHFFNPPRYMPLVEIIPHSKTDHEWLEQLETFLITRLGKSVVRSKDTPGFIANRIGMFSMLSSLYHAEQFNLAPDTVDLLTGSLLGRSNTATYQSLDKIGLDTFAKVQQSMFENLIQDPWRGIYKIPAWIMALIQKSALGEKTKVGIYKTVQKDVWVVDKQGNYRPIQQKLNSDITAILKIQDAFERFHEIRNQSSNEARFLWAILRDLFHYSAYHLASIAETVREIDLAMRLVYGFTQGPFELWQSIGWKKVIEWIEQDIDTKSSLSLVPLPTWVYELGDKGVYKNNAVFSPERKIYLTQSKLPIYQKQLYPELLTFDIETREHIIFESKVLKMWTMRDDIAIVSFTTKNPSFSIEFFEAMNEAIKRAEKEYRALIFWQKKNQNFSTGFDLGALKASIANTKEPSFYLNNTLSEIIKLLQKTVLNIRYATIPTIAAIQGNTKGFGLELMMHCSRTVAAMESYLGFVEVEHGLIPVGGGIKELARQASEFSKDEDPFQLVKRYFKIIVDSQQTNSAKEAKQLGFLKETDTIVMNSNELLYVAKQVAWCLSESNFYPPLKPRIVVAGKSGRASLQVCLIKLRENGLIDDHVYYVGSHLANVLCGGEVPEGFTVSEEWILELERYAWLELLQPQKIEETRNLEAMEKISKASIFHLNQDNVKDNVARII